MRLALYQPDIPQNTGTILRTAMCLGLPVDIIEPCGFIFSSKQLKRAGMDYLNQADITRHDSWTAFQDFVAKEEARLVLLSTKASGLYTDFAYLKDDILMLGRESAGVPKSVFESTDAQVRIAMKDGARSLNVAISAAMVAGEALRQTSSQA